MNKKVLPIKMWLGQEGMLLIKMFTQEEQEKCKTRMGQYSVVNSEFKPHHNYIIISLQYQKLHRKSN